MRAPVAQQTVVEEYPPPPPPREPKLWPWLLALLALVLLGVAVGAGYALTRNSDTANASSPTTTTTTQAVATTVDVPDVIGRRADVAASALVKVGLKPDFRRKLSKRPSGTVIEQDPGAATSVARGSSVAVTISRGVDTVSVPALTGLALQDAVQKLQAAGLKAAARRVGSKKPDGQVVAQIPGGSAELKKGAVVKLLISKGVEKIDVPDVVGQPSAAAATALTQAGLQAAPHQVPSDQPKGTVVAQSPKAGDRAAKGSKVLINVSGGRTATSGTTTTTTTTTTQSATVTIPDLVGSTFADARRQLRDLGLRADRRDVPSTEPFGNVVAQFPAAGGTAKRGGSIRVNVSKGPPTATIPDVTGDDQDTAQQKLQKAGFTVNVETTDTNDPAEDGVVLDQAPAPGATGKRGAKVTITVGVLTGG